MSAIATYMPAYVRTRIRPSFAKLTVTVFISILILVVVGSIAYVTGYGLGCPDWPLCHGQVIPPPKLAAWVEFTHRLVGAATSYKLCC